MYNKTTYHNFISTTIFNNINNTATMPNRFNKIKISVIIIAQALQCRQPHILFTITQPINTTN